MSRRELKINKNMQKILMEYLMRKKKRLLPRVYFCKRNSHSSRHEVCQSVFVCYERKRLFRGGAYRFGEGKIFYSKSSGQRLKNEILPAP